MSGVLIPFLMPVHPGASQSSLIPDSMPVHPGAPTVPLADVKHHTFLWIEGYYNRRRRHSTLNYLTPHEYELGYRQLTDLAA
jgi:hypothetical protein